MKLQIILLSTLSLFMTYCINSNEERGFYEFTAYNDECRIPLVNPYEIFSFNGGKSWFYKFRDSTIVMNEFSGIDSIGVSDSTIVLFSGEQFIYRELNKRTQLITKGVEPIWLVIDVKTDTEMPIPRIYNYHRILDSLNVKRLKLYAPDKIFRSFETDLKLPWKQKTNH